MPNALVMLGLMVASLTADTPAQPASSDDEVWDMAARVNTVPAYEAYLNRFEQGRHHDQAVEAFYRLQGQPVLVAPPPPPRAPGILPPPPPPPLVVDPCTSLLVDYRRDRVNSEEAEALDQAMRSNRPADHRAFVNRFPESVCRERMDRLISMREARSRRFVPIAGFGPLAPRLMPGPHISEDDYPASALRSNESGTVGAEWVVAEDGIVESCRIVRSSGSTALDDATCRIVTRRFRYDPARDAAGAPTPSTGRTNVTWAIPSEQASEAEPSREAPQ